MEKASAGLGELTLFSLYLSEKAATTTTWPPEWRLAPKLSAISSLVASSHAEYANKTKRNKVVLV
jgi:hypothetical protein